MDGLTSEMIPALLKIGSVGLILGWVLKFVEAWMAEWRFTAGKPQFPFSNFIPIANMILGASLGARWGVGEIWGLAAAGAGAAGVAELMKLIPGLSVQKAAATTAKVTRAAPVLLLLALPLLASPASADDWRWDAGTKVSLVNALWSSDGFSVEVINPRSLESVAGALGLGLSYHDGEGAGVNATVSYSGSYVQPTVLAFKEYISAGVGYRFAVRQPTVVTIHGLEVAIDPPAGAVGSFVLAFGAAAPADLAPAHD